MKITILMGSPNKNGSTSILADEFKRGAEEAGHTCEVIDVCHANIHPCIGCVACGYEGPCVQNDDVEMIRAKLLSSDMVVFATPLYYGDHSEEGWKTKPTTIVKPEVPSVDWEKESSEILYHSI